VLRRSLRTRITTRVLALSATVAVLLGVTLVVLIIAVIGQRDAARAAFRSQRALTMTKGLETSLFAIENSLHDAIQKGLPPMSSPVGPPLRPVRTGLLKYPARFGALARQVSDDQGQHARLDAIKAKISDYVTKADLLRQLALDDIRQAGAQLFYPDRPRLAASLARDLRALGERERTLVLQREGSAEARSSFAIAFGIGGLGLVLLVVVGGTLYLRRAVVRPVVSVAQATGELAAGELSTRVPESREDEIGDLARGFNSMADSLERSQLQLERSNADLLRSNAELEQFASVTSHDLQAPLTTISMYAELLERRHGTGSAGGHDLIGGIRGATQQARTLIRDLLEYSRAGRGELSAEPLPAGVVVDQALEALAGTIETTGARVQVGSLPVVIADRSNLCRVFQNLVGNAVKFTRGDGPEVTIAAEPEGPMWRFDVRDNGIGMDPGDTRRIFEPFRRLHGEEDYSGTGIGLAVCERIIEQHGGRIWVTSRPGEGSVFSFTMPSAERDDETSADLVQPPITASQ
jgi:signal transduction histidine kinase